MRLEKHLCLLGFMGSGKSTLGKMLAQRLGVSWVDTDQLVEAKQGESISDIVRLQGWDAFRAMEREVVLEIESHVPMVISCGGGFPLDQQNWQWITKHCTSIFLKVDQEVLLDRLAVNASNRPLIQEKNYFELTQFINEQLPKRALVYSKADLTIVANGAPERTLECIMQLI